MKTKKSTSAISFETPTKQSYWGQPNETIRKSEPTTFPQSMIEELVHLKKTLIEITDPNLDPCVQNMHYYLAIKKRDLTHLEELLPTYGLMAPSTWNSSVAHALNTILQRISDSTGQRYGDDLPAVTIRDLVDRATNRKQFFQGKETSPSIMLTLPSTAAQDEKFIQQAVEAGVRFFRINSAHDTLEDRKAMA